MTDNMIANVSIVFKEFVQLLRSYNHTNFNKMTQCTHIKISNLDCFIELFDFLNEQFLGMNAIFEILNLLQNLL